MLRRDLITRPALAGYSCSCHAMFGDSAWPARPVKQFCNPCGIRGSRHNGDGDAVPVEQDPAWIKQKRFLE
jgi:hypothetical protein